jgi:hypothetical protein
MSASAMLLVFMLVDARPVEKPMKGVSRGRAQSRLLINSRPFAKTLAFSAEWG